MSRNRNNAGGAGRNNNNSPNNNNRNANGANGQGNNKKGPKQWCHSHQWGNHSSQNCNKPKPGHDENATPPPPESNNRSNNNRDDSNVICNYCEEVGHHTSKCRANPQNQNVSQGPDPGAIPFQANNRPGEPTNETLSFGEAGFRGFVRDTEPRWRAAGLRKDETSEAAKKPYCCFCNTTDHEESQCRNIEGKIKYHDSKLGCAGCRVRGHLKDECKNPISQRCMKCQRKGHLTAECRIAKTTAMDQFISAVSAPTSTSRFRWQNVDKIIPNRVQALRLWLENERRQAQLASRFISYEEMITVEQLLREVENAEGQRAQLFTDQASAVAQLQDDLIDLMAEVQNRTQIMRLSMNYDVSGDIPVVPVSYITHQPPIRRLSKQFEGSNIYTMPRPLDFGPCDGRRGDIPGIQRPGAYSMPPRPNMNMPSNIRRNQPQNIAMEEAYQKVLWERRREVDNQIQSKINKSKRYGHCHINNSLLRIERQIMEKQLLSRNRMDEIKYAMSRRVQFFRDPEAVKALFERKRPCCMKCGEKGHILDRHFAAVKETATTAEIMRLEDFDDWGIVVAFECDCSVARSNGQPVGNYSYMDIPHYVKNSIIDEF